jgi:hypothetical protein
MYDHELQQTDFRYHTSFHHINNEAVYHDFLQKGLSKAVAICGPAD